MRLTNQEKNWIKDLREVMAAHANGLMAISTMSIPSTFSFIVFTHNRHAQLMEIAVQPREGKLFIFREDEIELSEHKSHNSYMEACEYWGYDTKFVQNF